MPIEMVVRIGAIKFVKRFLEVPRKRAIELVRDISHVELSLRSPEAGMFSYS
jgi:hypothetical protein